ncbi:hypothetical protein [Croceicoccus sediminis]|uniref:hypothetical protein n=1 Tax=Croceicoccus sediminis TaxID=2571150 RepID=UPI0011826CE8|nr:hypothetical protein [Croceicoccus sediminis]
MILSAVLAILLQAAAAPEAPPEPSPPACSTDRHGEFDFWVGEWDVYRFGTDTKVAQSRIERMHSGCAIRETWMPLKGDGGSSLSNFEPATGLWHQTWIGAAPGRVEFQGGSPAEGTMVLTGWWRNVAGPEKHGWIRMTYTVGPDGSVRQHGELSTDHGLKWKTAFDFAYRAKK